MPLAQPASMRASSDAGPDATSALASAALGASGPVDAALGAMPASSAYPMGFSAQAGKGVSTVQLGSNQASAGEMLQAQHVVQQQLLQQQQLEQQQQMQQQQLLLQGGAQPPGTAQMQTIFDPRTGLAARVSVPPPDPGALLPLGPDGQPQSLAHMSGAPPLPQPLGVPGPAQQQQQQHHHNQLLAQMASSQQMANSQQLHAHGSGGLGAVGTASAPLAFISEQGGPLQMPGSPSRAGPNITPGGYPMQPASMAMPQVSQAALHAMQVSQAMLVSQAMSDHGVSPAAQGQLLQHQQQQHHLQQHNQQQQRQQQQQQQQQHIAQAAAQQQLAAQQSAQQQASQQQAAHQAAAMAQQQQFEHLNSSALHRVANLAQAAAAAGSQQVPSPLCELS